ncbi:POU domain class 2-associating factor 1 isoform A [Alligator mississippiensis]|uniref:POU domain class 2-associating factor 1 isoform A n=1 Tax=Alligator mississippiensis TaxID=8496 RepID=A0A151NG41_ALLMI|nr:POU domain class 2-associating factor 1 isoform A [Alligator mississippiensis]
MHWQKSSTSEQQQQPRPYQGVRVKEPVKELLKRKRGNLHNANTTAATTVVLPHQPLPSYSPIGQPCIDMDVTASALPITEEGALCSGWLSQPSPASLQPLTQWTTYPDYVSHEAVSCPYTADMYVQPMCPSYTLVGPSSVLTYASQPLITNFAPRSTTPAVVPQLEVTDQQAPLTYFPWPQPISALPASTLQYQPASSTLPGPQFVPLPISIPEPAPQELEDARRVINTLPIEKLLLEDDDNDTILHIYAAKGMRAYTLAAAERMRELRRLDAKEHRGKTPLLVAVTAKQPAIVNDLLLTGADVSAVDDKGQSALHLAATYGYAQVLQVIMSSGLPLDLEMKDFEGHTPLHCAVLCHNSLLREQRCHFMITEDRKKELQHQMGEVQLCIHLLVHMGASIYSRDVKSNKTVLHYTVQDGNVSLLKYFLELNAFKSKDFVNSKAHGNTALHMAAALHRDKNQEEIVKLLLDHGADPSIRNLDNDQAIHMVPAGKAGDRVRHLLKKGRVTSTLASCRRNARC